MRSRGDGRWPPDLSMWTIYDHPTDYPDNFIAREWIIGREPAAISITDNVIIGSLENIRMRLQAKGLMRLRRDRNDDEKIIESWL